MKFLFACLLTSFSIYCGAQVMPTTKLPILVPPSPEVAELSRFMQASTQMFTGASNVQVPLYTLQTGNIKTNISLNYSNNGIKVNDIPGRAGLGWNVLAGGSISRTVHDEPDEKSSFLSPPNFDAPISDTDYLLYLKTALKYGYDTEYDIYSINVAGLSGKFFFDKTGTPRLIDHSKIKIERTGGLLSEISTFTVTDEDGIKYFFGQNDIIERTTSVVLNGMSPKFNVQATTWFLTKVQTPEGHEVSYNYSGVSFEANLGPAQFVILQTPQNATGSPCGVCNPVMGQVTYNKISYSSFYLTSIQTSNNQNVSFSYEERPDLSGDVRLTRISANDQKVYVFEYLDVTHSSTEVNKKFFLTKMYTQESEGGTEGRLTHLFEYNNPTSVPDQTSLSQDYFGYFNNAGNSTNFFPKIPYYEQYVNGALGANRNPSFSSVGALQKVTYPTGGSEEYYYEPHTISTSVTETIWTHFNLLGTGTGRNTAVTVTSDFTPNQTQTVSGQFTVGLSPGAPTPSDPDYNPPSNRQLAEIQLWDVTNDQMLWLKRNFFDYGVTPIAAVLTAGIKYQFRITVYGRTPHAFVFFKYDPVETTFNVNKPGCGIRVSNIRSFDPESQKATFRYFKYASMDKPDVSSGIGDIGRPNIESGMALGGFCAGSGFGNSLITCPSAIGINASSRSYPNFSGSPIAYKYVLESNDKDFLNGGIMHEFYAVSGNTGIINFLNQPSFNNPVSESPDLNGIEKATYYFKKNASKFIPVKDILNEYEINWQLANITNHTVKRSWDYNGAGDATMPSTTDKLSGYSIGGYTYNSGVVYLKNTTTKTYDDAGLNPLTGLESFTYNTDYTKKIKITSNSSDGSNHVTSLTYPENYATAPYTDMVLRNMLNPVVEQTIVKTVGATVSPVSYVKTDFKDWFSDKTVIKPELVKFKVGNGTLNNKLRFFEYNRTGNPTDLSEENGPRISYIWDDRGSRPIAEVNNSIRADVAYTSFEPFSKGGWSYAGAGTTGSFTPTGQYSYQPVSGAITKSGLRSNITYTVSYWTNNATSYAITGTLSGYPIKVKTVKGWSLYLHEVSGVTSVSISNSGSWSIDELRLYPVDAQMKTMTYNSIENLSSSTDIRGNTEYYEYDNFQRLAIVKDEDGNIIKHFCYNYAGQQTDCPIGTVVLIPLTYSNFTTSGGRIDGLKIKNSYGAVLYDFNTAALQAGQKIPKGIYTFEFTMPVSGWLSLVGNFINSSIVLDNNGSVTYTSNNVDLTNSTSINLELYSEFARMSQPRN